MSAPNAGQIIVLNGAPRSGKSSIARVIQDTFEGNWINLGVDGSMAATPQRLQPGIGLRPGGELSELEPVVKKLYRALFASMVVHSQLGFNIVADVGIHDGYSAPLGILDDMRSILAGQPLFFVGVMCPLETIMARRNADPHNGLYLAGFIVPPPVRLWQYEVHRNKGYDMTVDTSRMPPDECAHAILTAMAERYGFDAPPPFIRPEDGAPDEPA